MIKKKYWGLLFLGGIFLTLTLKGQDSLRNPMYFSVKPQYGFIIPHSSSIREVSDVHPYGFEVESGWYLVQQENWERCNCYSRAGLSLLHMDYRMPDILGSSTNFIAFAEPFFNYRGFVLSSVRMGVGVSYLSKVYDPDSNPRNLFFSSPVSFLVHIDVNLTKYISDRWFLNAYFKYNHISNGGIEKPNKGMNFPSYGLGVGYTFNQVQFADKPKKKLEKPVPILPSLQVFGTLRSTTPEDGFFDRKLALGMILKARRKFTLINALNLGVEGTIDYSVKDKMKDAQDPKDHKQFAILAGHDFTFGKFIFSQYWGTYLYAPYYSKKQFYQRYSLTFEFIENLKVGVTLKAHAEVAENFNLMLEYDLHE